jgi:hypothetical protein
MADTSFSVATAAAAAKAASAETVTLLFKVLFAVSRDSTVNKNPPNHMFFHPLVNNCNENK